MEFILIIVILIAICIFAYRPSYLTKLIKSIKNKSSTLLALLGSTLIIYSFPHRWVSSPSTKTKYGFELTTDRPLVFLIFLISFYVFLNSIIKIFREHYNRRNYGITLLILGMIPLSYITFLIFTLEQHYFPYGLWIAFVGNALIVIGGINEINVKPKIIQEAAIEIEKLLEQLSRNYSTNTTEEKIEVVGKAIDEIENNPELKTKVINAIKAGGIEALRTLIKHPLVNILMATLEGFEKTKES